MSLISIRTWWESRTVPSPSSRTITHFNKNERHHGCTACYATVMGFLTCVIHGPSLQTELLYASIAQIKCFGEQTLFLLDQLIFKLPPFFWLLCTKSYSTK
ncbi:hypothetical protein BDA99DRAFT_540774 [Phascolomyces articulosus]|uniref:Uncharacterized protein n=1 Tax=Phascolomyces articulosus TaxID=60185 RepID=A0AAD5JTE6_9FUNG|nr:hypothetical protein BDA99DRAFT_540774 [Phascolomyces articulosus]